MSDVVIRIEGRSYLTLEAVSRCYGCEVTWIREAYDVGLFGEGIVHAGSILLRISVLDRVAEVVRLGRYQGMGLEAIVVLLGEDAGEPDAVDVEPET
ncbi:MAG TPA: hypothetical protein VGK20_16085 [Candidatus Binatia bacterium]|jgi:hypothetical protein